MTTTRRTRRLAKIGSGAAGLGLAAVAVLGFSNAAFSAKADNASNNWAADGTPATIADVNKSVDAPLFSFGLDGAAKPKSGSHQMAKYDGLLTSDPTQLNTTDDANGDGVRDVTIEYKGKSAADIRMFAEYSATDVVGALDQHTVVTVTRDGQPVYSGTLAAMPTDYASAKTSGNWITSNNPTGAAQDATYKVTIKTDADPAAASQIKNVKFVWEAQQDAS